MRRQWAVAYLLFEAAFRIFALPDGYGSACGVANRLQFCIAKNKMSLSNGLFEPFPENLLLTGTPAAVFC